MIKITQKKRSYHQRVLQEVAQMLRLSGKQREVETKPTECADHEWAAQKVQQLVKA
jgi:hypothetical protein